MAIQVSIGIFAHNEEKYIAKCIESLLNQKLKNVKIKEILVFSDASIDKTDEIVNEFAKKHRIVRLITSKERKGKWEAINRFIKRSKSDVLISSSADLVFEKDVIETLGKCFNDKKIGIASPKIIPKTKNRLVDMMFKVEWELHHHISLQIPKFGEVVAFRKVFDSIPKTAGDEEEIARIIYSKGLKGKYCKDAIVYNFSPETIIDFIFQRRRISCAHFELQAKGHLLPTDNPKLLMNSIIMSFKNKKSSREKIKWLFFLILTSLIELFSRLLGFLDFLTNKEKHYAWKPIKK